MIVLQETPIATTKEVQLAQVYMLTLDSNTGSYGGRWRGAGAVLRRRCQRRRDVTTRWRHVFLLHLLQCRFQFLDLDVLRFHNNK